jgi:hypothetical protein
LFNPVLRSNALILNFHILSLPVHVLASDTWNHKLTTSSILAKILSKIVGIFFYSPSVVDYGLL